MKINHRFRSSLCLVIASLALLGCLPEKKVVWSPDGKHAAVLGREGLYLCDENGRLTPLLVSNVVLAAWLPDSQRLVVNQTNKVKTWAELVTALDPEQVGIVTNLAGSALDHARKGNKFTLKPVQEGDKEYKTAVALYLREVQAEALKAFDSKDTAERVLLRGHIGAVAMALKAFDSKDTAEVEECGVSTVRMATLTADRIELGATLIRLPVGLVELRANAPGTAVVLADETTALYVAPVDGSQPAKSIATRAAVYPDWTPDGQSLVFIKAVGTADITVASLARKRIFTEAGALDPAADDDDLAGLLFDTLLKVRCLRDGRIVFSATELHLPLTTKDMPQRESLFALDPQRNATVQRLVPREAEERLPKKWMSFEISPDEKRVSAMMDEGGSVLVFDLASAQVHTVQASLKDLHREVVVRDETGKTVETVKVPQGGDGPLFVPTWRYPNELCFAAFNPRAATNQPSWTVSLWKDGKARAISQDWPEEVTGKLFEDGK